MEIHQARLVVLAVLVAVAAAYDITSRTIPNWLTSASLLLGILLAALAGPAELGFRLLAALVMLVVGLPLFKLKILGGGDVKLLVAVAALVGFALLPKVVLYAGLAGGAIALAAAIRRGIFLPLILDSRDAALYYATFGRHGRRVPRARGLQLTVPYAVAIGIGALAAWFA